MFFGFAEKVGGAVVSLTFCSSEDEKGLSPYMQDDLVWCTSAVSERWFLFQIKKRAGVRFHALIG